MKRFKNILLIFEGQGREKSTLIRAITLARANKARLTVANDKKELNDKIMQLATSMTFREGGELHILHAWEVTGEHLLRSGFSGVPSEEVDTLVYETENLHKEWLNNLVARHSLEESQTRIH